MPWFPEGDVDESKCQEVQFGGAVAQDADCCGKPADMSCAQPTRFRQVLYAKAGCPPDDTPPAFA